MTKIEKETVAAALSEYTFNHQKAAERAHKKKDYETERAEHAHALTAGAILTYWSEIVSAPVGTIEI